MIAVTKPDILVWNSLLSSQSLVSAGTRRVSDLNDGINQYICECCSKSSNIQNIPALTRLYVSQIHQKLAKLLNARSSWGIKIVKNNMLSNPREGEKFSSRTISYINGNHPRNFLFNFDFFRQVPNSEQERC